MTDLIQIETVAVCAVGLQLVQVSASTIPGEIEAGDLLRIDFDQHAVSKDGFYVLQLGDWTGVRRFADTLEGPKVLDIDEWRPLPGGVQIMGYVDKVYTGRGAVNRARGVRHG
ncbi:hypothetical protein [Variovorax boronicumulans]|uniref:hypothetical protein n=1 Tax=Variovorax boronicumulans TaxID=436515 RepID=UPI0033962DB6